MKRARQRPWQFRSGPGPAHPSWLGKASYGVPTDTDGIGESGEPIDYAHQIAGEIKGFGVRRPETLTGKMFDKPLVDLSRLDASGLIDMLKNIKVGKIKLGDALNGAAA